MRLDRFKTVQGLEAERFDLNSSGMVTVHQRFKMAQFGRFGGVQKVSMSRDNSFLKNQPLSLAAFIKQPHRSIFNVRYDCRRSFCFHSNSFQQHELHDDPYEHITILAS